MPESDLGGAVKGFVMPAIPDEFFTTMNKASGPARTVGEFQHLLNGDGFLARRQIPLSDRHRYELLEVAADAGVDLDGPGAGTPDPVRVERGLLVALDDAHGVPRPQLDDGPLEQAGLARSG